MSSVPFFSKSEPVEPGDGHHQLIQNAMVSSDAARCDDFTVNGMPLLLPKNRAAEVKLLPEMWLVCLLPSSWTAGARGTRAAAVRSSDPSIPPTFPGTVAPSPSNVLHNFKNKKI